MGLKVTSMRDDLRKSFSSQSRPIQLASSKRCNPSMPSITWPSMAIMRSPSATPRACRGTARHDFEDVYRCLVRQAEVAHHTGGDRHGGAGHADIGPPHAPMRENLPDDPFGRIDPRGKQIACACGIIAVFTPITRPFESTSGPPEFPGLSAASVWITSCISRPDVARNVRPSAEITPVVTVFEYPSGLPIAIATWPTRTRDESPNST